MKSRQTPGGIFAGKFVALGKSISIFFFFFKQTIRIIIALSHFFFFFNLISRLIVSILIFYITSMHSSFIQSYIYIYIYKKTNNLHKTTSV